MKRILVKQLNSKVGEKVKLNGWIHRIRKLGKIAFILLRDRSGIVQCVVETNKIDISQLRLESVIQITGLVCKNNASNFEVQVGDMLIFNAVSNELPLEVNTENLNANLDTILSNRVLSLRHKKINSIFKIEAAIAHAFSKFLQEQDFTEIFSPKIVSDGAEGGTEVFKLDYFGKTAYLAQSPQFYKQMLVGAGYERVFEIGHVYRAESHDSKRHINEFVSLDLEMAFIQNENDLISFEIKLLSYIFEYLKANCCEELTLLEVSIPSLNNIPIIPLAEAIEILKTKYGKLKLKEDIDHEGEELICKYAMEVFNSEFIFLTNYPIAKRPMYTMPHEDNKTTASFDLIFRGIEITTGGQRIHNYEKLKTNFINKGLNPDNFSSYLDAFSLGMPPHGGFAIGLERLTYKLLKLDNIREAVLFTRDKTRLNP